MESSPLRARDPRRGMQKLMEYLACPIPWHPHQRHLAEWQAFSTREILFNLDQSVEARNMAQKQAARHKCLLTKDGEENEDTMSKPKIIIEDLGGALADLYDETHPQDTTNAHVHHHAGASKDGRA